MQKPDVLVIGGGINGVSAALHLARQGAKVALIEKSFIAGGPTGHSSAIIRQHYSNPVTARMALHSLQVWQNFDELVGGDCAFTQTGFLIAVGEEDVDGLRVNIAMQQKLGIKTSFVTPQEIHSLEPQAVVDGIGGGAYEPDGGYCDPALAANAFAAAARRFGCTIRTGVKATGVQIVKDTVTGVKTSEGVISAGKVLIAGGPWTPLLLSDLGVSLPVIAARIKIGLYRRPEGFNKHHIWGDFTTQIYLRPETGRLMLVGSISPQEAEDRVADPDHFSEQISLDILTDFAERAARRFPAMINSHLFNQYASLYDITPDWHPVIDAVPGISGLYVCAGSSGHGFKLSPAVGAMVSRLMLEGKKPNDDVNLFAWNRFARGDLVSGQYSYSIIG